MVNDGDGGSRARGGGGGDDVSVDGLVLCFRRVGVECVQDAITPFPHMEFHVMPQWTPTIHGPRRRIVTSDFAG